MKRIMNKIITVLLIIIPAGSFAQESTPLPAAAEKEKISTEYQEVNGLENWSYNYDISDYPDGEYNLIIRSTDKAGNVSIDGPINIFIDSKSDLPSVSISSPSGNMRVGGNFTVIGTANDDDGIEIVEVRLDDGPFVKADGSNFWSKFMSVESVPDGVHTVTARATDVNGLKSSEVSVKFNLDKTKPEITITSHTNGEILSRQVTIKGKVYDANGVESLEYSLDGNTYKELKLSGKKNPVERNFSLKIDTRDNKSGTDYIWFRAKDGTGSEGASTFVYYSDNEDPEITIEYPKEESVLNGYVTVAGTVTDKVGLKSFSCTFDKNEIFIPLTTGNPYWSRTFDLHGRKSARIIFNAVDLSGNTSTYKLDLKLDNDTDLPVVKLLDTDEKNFIEDVDPDDGYIRGIAEDDDGIKSVEYSIDKGEYRAVDTNGPFIIPVGDLEPGSHSIEIHGVDIFDLKGDNKKFGFNIIQKTPDISLVKYSTDKVSGQPFFEGIIFRQDKGGKLEGVISGGEGELKASFKIGSREESPVKISKGKFQITIPKDLEPGGYDISIKVSDKLGRQSLLTSRFYIAPMPEKGKEYHPVRIEKQDGLFIPDARLSSKNIINITTDKPLSGYITGYTIEEKIVAPAVINKENPKKSTEAVIKELVTNDTIESAKLEPAQENFRIEVNGNSFKIVPVSESGPVSFTVKVKTSFGREYKSGKINAGSDIMVPELIIENRENAVLTDTLKLTGSFSDNTGIKAAWIELGGSKQELKDADFDMDIDLSPLKEGAYFCRIGITDLFGNTKTQTIPFAIDRTPAKLSIIQPSLDSAVEGMITVTGKIDNFINGGELYFSKDGQEFTKVQIEGDNCFSYDLDLSEEGIDPKALVFKAVDQGGNTALLKPTFNVDLEADRPSVSIEIPADGSTIRDDFKISGLVFDDDEVGKIFYSIDGDEFREIEGNKYFNIPWSLNSLNDGKHTVTVRAEDSGGFMSEDTSVEFLVSKAEPVSKLLSPGLDYYAKGNIVIEGQTYDQNGIGSVFVSYDNGITFNEAVLENVVQEESGNLSTVNWKYNLDTMLPGDGTHSILIKAVDTAGTVGISSALINIDNTPPEIKLDYPRESESVAGTLVIDGKVFDGTRIKTVEAELKSLDGSGESLKKIIETENVFREIIDLKDYEPGLYNLTLTVADFADNTISETRNFRIVPVQSYKSIDIFFPEEGKAVVGDFPVEGRMNNMKDAKKAVLKIDGHVYKTADINSYGLFSFSLGKEDLTEGRHVLSVESDDAENKIVSKPRNISFNSEGPWLRVDNLVSGQFVSNRPLITGTAGYDGPGADEKTKRVKKIEVSLDNGRSFKSAKGKESWQFRLETYDMNEGINQIIIRSVLEDGQECVSKLFVNVDETSPSVNLLMPEENKRFNGTVTIIGTAGDENGLKSVEVLIREGKKEKYQVPSFVQGLYIDAHAMGATYGEIGVGLSFFKDVVKLQAQVGMAPPGRFSGLVIGGKLLANIIDIPFSYFFGYDWEFFSMSVALGANFNYFTMSEDSIEFTDKGVVLGSILAQYEFAKFTFKDMKMFNRYSLYVEGSLWFISSDVQAGVVPRYSVGARIGVF